MFYYNEKNDIWFNKLKKSNYLLNKNIYLFIWFIIYILNTLSFILYVFNNNYNIEGILLFIIQFIINLLWKFLFLKYKLLFDLYNLNIILNIFIILTYLNFSRVNIYISNMLIPYILLSFYGLYINYNMVKYNCIQMKNFWN